VYLEIIIVDPYKILSAGCCYGRNFLLSVIVEETRYRSSVYKGKVMIDVVSWKVYGFKVAISGHLDSDQAFMQI
jgi:hypothetical protein